MDRMVSRAGSEYPFKQELTYRDVINITSNPPAQRTKREVQVVSDWIRKQTALFAGNGSRIVEILFFLI